MNKHVQKIQKELDEAKEKLEKQQNKKVEEKHLFDCQDTCEHGLCCSYL